MSKVTEWYPHDVKPVHIGQYEVSNGDGVSQRSKAYLVGRSMRFWDGSQWRSWQGGPVSVFGQSSSHRWRGLSKKSGGQA